MQHAKAIAHPRTDIAMTQEVFVAHLRLFHDLERVISARGAMLHDANPAERACANSSMHSQILRTQRTKFCCSQLELVNEAVR